MKLIQLLLAIFAMGCALAMLYNAVATHSLMRLVSVFVNFILVTLTAVLTHLSYEEYVNR